MAREKSWGIIGLFLYFACSPAVSWGQILLPPINFPVPLPIASVFEDPVDRAIRLGRPSATATWLANFRLSAVIGTFRLNGAPQSANLLRMFVDGQATTGEIVSYGSASTIATQARVDKWGKFTHSEAHQRALGYIRDHFEEQISSGATEFPDKILLGSNMGFTPEGTDRLMGPDFSSEWKLDLALLDRFELAMAFGDMAPAHLGKSHQGQIANVRVTPTPLGNGDTRFTYSFDVQYDWADEYSFWNDVDRGWPFKEAYYLEMIAKTAKPFETRLIMTEQVTETFVLHKDGSITRGTSQSRPGPEVNDPIITTATAPGGSGGSSPGKMPPINIERPPGWGVGK